MSARNRNSNAVPTASRQSIPASQGLPRTANTLPPYKKPSHPLNQRAQLRLQELSNPRNTSTLREHNKKAATLITDAAGLINDQLHEREERVERRRKKWERGIHVEEQKEQENELQELSQNVEDLTRRLEESMRGAIDGEEAIRRMEDLLSWVRDNVPGQQQEEYDTQTSQRQSQSQRRERQDEDGDEDMEDEDEDAPSPGPTPLSQARVVLTGPSELLKDRIQRKKDDYQSLSHGTRYAKHNAYIGFKAIVHDAKYGDSGPTLPHPDTWFTERGSPAPGVTATQNESDDDDDIVVDRAKISTRCPITFLPLKDPYTSIKCPHTFEKVAIMQMISLSTVRIGGSGRGQGEKAAQCPVTGCDQMLSKLDLRQDPVIIRKIKRMQQAENAEDSEPEEDTAISSREHHIGSSIDENQPSSKGPQPKHEPQSTEPASHMPPRSSEIVDLGEPSDDSDEDEDEDMV